MILNEVNFFSETLGLLSSMYVLLPQRTLADAQKKRRTETPHALPSARSFGRPYCLAALHFHRTLCGRLEPCRGDAGCPFEFLQ